jgi:coenzyme F420-reducing hydrogenase delta subunit
MHNCLLKYAASRHGVTMDDFEPVIIGFLCHWCSYEGADAVGRARKTYPAGLRIVRVPCSGRVDPELVLTAFQKGCDGVIILGCRPGECHYRQGNRLALKQEALLKRVLPTFGIEPLRFNLDWVAAGEPDRLVEMVTGMMERVSRLGSLHRNRIRE